MIVPPVPQAAIDLVKKFEGCRLGRYSDIAGNATIGYGHLCKPGDGLNYIDENTAEKLLVQDLLVAAAAVVRYTKVPLNENQYAALIDFAFNEGCGSLQRSIILQKINRSEFSEVPKEFMRWVWAKGRRQKGLIARRQAEIDLFMGTA
jgi:lysozyme